MNIESDITGPDITDPEIEEELKEYLGDLYEKWKNCSCDVGTEKDRRDAFLIAIKRRLERGFSIIADPGRYSEEIDMEKILGNMYRLWKNYMKDYLGEDAAVDFFIEKAKQDLELIVGKKDVHWKKEDY